MAFRSNISGWSTSGRRPARRRARRPRAPHSSGDDAAGRGRGLAQSLAGGAAGIALLHIERALADHGDWSTAHSWLSAAAHGQLSAGANANLFFGAPALAFITRAAASQPGRYERGLAQLDASTIALTSRRLGQAHARINRGALPALAEFDLIRGVAGLGAYHLHRHPGHEITRAVISYLVRLTAPLPGHAGLPGWWTDRSPNGQPSPDFPGGHGNFGMSHGVAAPLALLSLALRHDVVVDAHTEAIDRICDWLDAWRQERPGPWWPGIITRAQARDKHVDHFSRQRPSWCYGTPGLARAQQLAGLATGDTARQRMAEAALLGCLRDHALLDRITDIGLCHGTAGLLQVAWRVASDAQTPEITSELPRLTARLLAQLERPPHHAELFDGAAGAALALHTIGTGTAPLADWDDCLLLA